MRKIIIFVIFGWMLISGAGSVASAYNPVAAPGAVVVRDQVRFTVLTPRTVRMEWAPRGRFEDHASLVFVNRRLPVPEYSVKEEEGWLHLKTKVLDLFYRLGSGKFSAGNLRIEFSMDGRKKVWRPGMPNRGNLQGTTRTLDNCEANINLGTGRPIDLGQGLVSRDGWVLIDDSKRPIFDRSDWPWVQVRPEKNAQDWYFFAYGFNYKAALHDFILIAGRVPIPPRFAFGIWWSRYWEFSDSELRELVEGFRQRNLPLDVLVVDIDWHIRFLPEWFRDGRLMRDQAGQSAGWTGYTWDRHYFPDPKDFLDWTERQGLKVCLNLHPAAGIQPHEAVYPAMARAMGIDPATRRYVPFDIVNKRFAENYMRLVLHPLEKMGVDFWWLDWQQWSTTGVPGVNPTFYLNYVFFSDMEREGRARPLILHRYGGLGNHRYQIGFSGDVKISWRSLAYQPYFTATAANVCFGYWSHDIGGHMKGDSPPELYTRWIQWGAFSPIFRTHATKSREIERRIWAYPLPYYRAMRQAELLRHSLIPYLYSQARRTYETGVSLVHPLYYEFPRRKEAYSFPDEYFFGKDVLVRPVTRPLGKDSLGVMQRVWLPPGQWIEWFTGTVLEGDRVVRRAFALDEIPVYVRAGAILPRQAPLLPAAVPQPDPLILTVFPGDSGSTVLYEDEGNTDRYRQGVFAKTAIRMRRMNRRGLELIIEAVSGAFPGMLKRRSYLLQFPGTMPPALVTANGDTLPHSRYGRPGSWSYDKDDFAVTVHTFPQNVHGRLVVRLFFPPGEAAGLSGMKGRMRRLEKLVKFMAGYGRWDRARYPKQPVVRTAQTGLVLAQHPERAAEEMKAFPARWQRTMQIVHAAAKKYAPLRPYVVLLDQLEEESLLGRWK